MIVLLIGLGVEDGLFLVRTADFLLEVHDLRCRVKGNVVFGRFLVLGVNDVPQGNTMRKDGCFFVK